MLTKICKKIKNKAGETLSEVLVAALIAALGVTLFGTMVSSAFHIIRSSEAKMVEYYAAQNNAEKKAAAVQVDSTILNNRTLKIQPSGINSYSGFASNGDTGSYLINIYGDVSEKVLSYGGAEE